MLFVIAISSTHLLDRLHTQYQHCISWAIDCVLCVSSEDQCSHILSWWTLILFADDSLTVDNLTKVMEMGNADKIIEMWKELDQSLVKMITRNLSTTKEKIRACVDLYLNCHPHDIQPSWKGIASALYEHGEMAAAREAKSFLQQNGE